MGISIINLVRVDLDKRIYVEIDANNILEVDTNKKKITDLNPYHPELPLRRRPPSRRPQPLQVSSPSKTRIQDEIE